MKLVLVTLCLLSMTSMVTLAEDTSPRTRCLLGAEKHEQVVRKRLELLLSARRPELHQAQTVSVPTLATVLDSSGRHYIGSWTTTSLRLPSEVTMMQRELRLVAWRKNHCASLSNVPQSRGERLSAGRGGAWKPSAR